MLRILLADDHSIVRKGLIQILKEEYPFAEISEVCNGAELVEKATAASWDIVISDLSMPEKTGFEALELIKQAQPKLPVLILSVHPESEYAITALKAGAAGYLSKESAAEDLIFAVQRILAGKKYITAETAEKMASAMSNSSTESIHELLSHREMEVLKLLAAGSSITEIANTLSLSATTISTFRNRILTKMNLSNNADLIKYAIRFHLV